MNVTDHVDLDLVCQSPANESDELYAAMIDGRTIFQFLLLLESPGANASPSSPRDDSDARAWIQRINLAFVDQLASNVTSAASEPTGDAVPWAEIKRELRDSTDRLFSAWLGAELRLVDGDEQHIDAAIRDAAQRTLSDSVWWEACRRFEALGHSVPAAFRDHADAHLAVHPMQFLDTIRGLAPAQLCQELCAYWYPGWRRSLFIFRSPFDPLGGPDDLRQMLRESAATARREHAAPA